MEKKLKLLLGERSANQIKKVNLNNCPSTSIVGLTNEYTALERLSLSNMGLITLEGFPELPNLRTLELSYNLISNGLNYLTACTKLFYLNLSGNRIRDLESLKPLEQFKNLAILNLLNNDVTQVENYREQIIEMLPSLHFLDGSYCNDEEASSDSEDDDNENSWETDFSSEDTGSDECHDNNDDRDEDNSDAKMDGNEEDEDSDGEAKASTPLKPEESQPLA